MTKAEADKGERGHELTVLLLFTCCIKYKIKAGLLGGELPVAEGHTGFRTQNTEEL